MGMFELACTLRAKAYLTPYRCGLVHRMWVMLTMMMIITIIIVITSSLRLESDQLTACSSLSRSSLSLSSIIISTTTIPFVEISGGCKTWAGGLARSFNLVW